MTTDNPYGTPGDQNPPPPPGYGVPAYGAPGYGTSGYAATPAPSYPGQFGVPPAARPNYAHWGMRVVGYIIDWVATTVPFYVLLIVGAAVNSVLLVLLAVLVGIVIAFWNLWRQGETGATVGKQVIGLTLVRERDGQPIGGWMSIGRAFVHIIDAIPCYLGFLWPLWDEKRQTFADKVMSTVVLQRRS